MIITINNKLRKNQYIWIYVGLICILYCCRDVVNLGVPEIVFTAVCCIGFFTLDIGEAFALMAFTIPLTVPANEIRIVFLFVLLYKVLKKENAITFEKTGFIIVFLMITLEVVNDCIFSKVSFFQMIYSIVEFILILIIPLVWDSIRKFLTYESLKNAITCFIIGVIVSCLVLMYISIVSKGWTSIIAGDNRFGMGIEYDNNSSMQTSLNTNTIGNRCAICISLLIVLTEKCKFSKIIAIPLFVFFIFIIGLTKSRSSLICLCFIVLFYTLFTFIKKKELFKGIVIIAGAIAIIYLLIHLFPLMFDGFLARFVNQTDLSNGRLELDAQYLDIWQNNIWCFIFGFGTKSYGAITCLSNSPHSMVVDILISWGIVGVLLVVLWTGYLLKRTTKGMNRNHLFLVALPVLVVIFSVFDGQYLTVATNHLILCLIVISLSIVGVENRSEYNE